MEKTTKRWRATYEQPRIELCATEPYKFLAASPDGLGGGHDGGYNNGVIVDDAKGFGLDDDWGKLRGLNPDESWGDLWDF